MSEERIADLKAQITDLQKRWPAHSVPATMLEQLDELEEVLRKELLKESGVGEESDNDVQTLVVRVIGRVKNNFDKPATPEEIRSAESRIIIDPSLTPGLYGLEPGQQIMVVFYFHRSEGYELLQHPRGDQSRSKRGVFTLHSPNRPSPIGVTFVELVSIEGNVLRVRGLDAINDTPVLDLKLA
jgi:tRNA-Thr(GGU) m(6)t(6)A37 methyltransferase TsaA